ncbi:MAG: NAD(P)/FAD-dependent oxidoreductase [Planctomycetota bacterium]
MIAQTKGPEQWDVVVIGAGPGGSATAALLAQRGWRVLVLEKEQFPRFKIGESLLPGCLPVLERLGVKPGPDVFVYKRGARFLCETSGRAQVFAFVDALPGAATSAWHVERARFDTMLRDRAVALGAEVRHGETVVDAGVAGDHAWAETREQRFRCRYLVDASGQSRLLARRANAVVPYEQFGMCAVFTHFEDLAPEAYAELGPDFDIRVVLRKDGWSWIIPLPDRRLSVGTVSKHRVTPADLDGGILGFPLVTRLVRGARRLETRIVGNYSYKNTAPIGARYTAVGDAGCFLDPVFSSGVTLALRGAGDIVDRLDPALRAGTEDDPRLLADHQQAMERATATFAGLIDRFYNSHFAETVFLDGSTIGGEMRRGVMSVLAGDVWRTGNAFQEMLLSARRREQPGAAGA